MAVVLSRQVEVVMAQFVENNLSQVLQVKLRVHQRVDINVVISKVVAPARRLQPAIKDNLV